MIVTATDDGRTLIEGKKAAHLACGPTTFFLPTTKRFREGDGKKLYEMLKRFVSSGDFEAILVSGFEHVLETVDRAEVMEWISDHLKDNASCTLILAPIEPSQVPELV